MPIEFKLPELGENIDAADVVNVMVKPGDTIAKDQPVLELETEKAVLELPCPYAGRIEKINVKVGDHIPVGSAVLTIEPSEEGAAATPAPAPAEKPAEVQTQQEQGRPDVAEAMRTEQRRAENHRQDEGAGITPPPQPTRAAPPREQRSASEALTQAPRAEAPQQVPPESRGLAAKEPREQRPPAPASPAIRRLARELGVDLAQVKGTGPAGRITEDDLHAHVRTLAAAPKGGAAALEAPPLPDFEQWGPVDRQPISNIRRKTAETMTVAWRMVPQVTQYDLCDITDLEAQRKRYMQGKGEKSPKITVTAILLKAVVAALREFPKFNASLDLQAGQIVYKKYFHIGVAVDTENGLLVPVIRDVDRKSVVQLAKELDDVAKKARERKLGLEEMRGSCFTITNLGGIGGTAFSPIVYWPEVAILGVARARQEEVIRDDRSEIRLMLPLCLSYDHRIIDGADGARFTRRLAAILSDPLTLFMES